MSLYYGDKRTAQHDVGIVLEKRGWKLFGYLPDRSDLQSDYFCPARWDGVATKEVGGKVFVAVVMCNGRESGREIHDTKQVTEPCHDCAETGLQPDGWTFEQARADPAGFNEHRNGGRALLKVVSPLHFRGNHETCRSCHGTATKFVRAESTLVGRYPTYSGNPGRSNWHVETGGQILAKGNGLFSAYSPNAYLKREALQAAKVIPDGYKAFERYIADGIAAKIDALTGSEPLAPTIAAPAAAQMNEDFEREMEKLGDLDS